jgi:hypothetical protein
MSLLMEHSFKTVQDLNRYRKELNKAVASTSDGATNAVS